MLFQINLGSQDFQKLDLFGAHLLQLLRRMLQRCFCCEHSPPLDDSVLNVPNQIKLPEPGTQ